MVFTAPVIPVFPNSNYINPVTRGPDTYVVGTVFLGLATVVVALRLYTRLFIRRWFGLDDLCVCLAWLSTIGVTVSVYLLVFKHDFDRHVWDVPLISFKGAGKVFFIANIFWATSSSFIRLSLLFFYYRLIEHINARKYRWILHIMVSIHIAFLVSYIITLVFECVPVDAPWNFPYKIEPAKCLNLGRFMFSITIINTILELVVAMLPIPVILSLSMKRRDRWSAISVLCLGVVVFTAGCVRCWVVYQALLGTFDSTWWSGPQWICSEVENNIALICACAPALRPLLGRLLGKKTSNNTPDSTEAKSRILRSILTAQPKDRIRDPTDSKYVHFDLEGIANDGLAYTVGVLTDHGLLDSSESSGNWQDTENQLYQSSGSKSSGDWTDTMNRSLQKNRSKSSIEQKPQSETTLAKSREQGEKTIGVLRIEVRRDASGAEEMESMQSWKSMTEARTSFTIPSWTPFSNTATTSTMSSQEQTLEEYPRRVLYSTSSKRKGPLHPINSSR